MEKVILKENQKSLRPNETQLLHEGIQLFKNNAKITPLNKNIQI